MMKVKNTLKRRIGVNTPGGIFTLASGQTGEYSNVLNKDHLEAHGLNVTGKPDEGSSGETVTDDTKKSATSVTKDDKPTSGVASSEKAAKQAADNTTAPSGTKAS